MHARRANDLLALAVALITWAGWAEDAWAQGTKPGAAPPPTATPSTAPATGKPASPPASSPTTKGPAKGAKPLAPIDARLWLIAPSPATEWTVRIDNKGDAPLRVPADVRLLRFEIDAWDKKRKKTTKCSAPAGFRPQSFPEDRALYLKPGESYIETFDPRLVCFGKEAKALEGGNVVRARFGWDPPPKGSTKIPNPPYAVQGTDNPPSRAPLRELVAPTVVLSYAPPPAAESSIDKTQAKPSAASAQPTAKSNKSDKDKAEKKEGKEGDKPKEAPPFDANAARLEVSQDPFVEAAAPRNVAIKVIATNAGQRPMVAAIRPRMVSFRVDGPTQTFTCNASEPTHAVPRDAYRTVRAKQKVTMSVLLFEACPREAFPRPGLYRVAATLEAGETGEEAKLDAYTALIPTTAPTLLRLHSAPERFYGSPPKAVPTPKPEESD
jgi:hypothetical protein